MTLVWSLAAALLAVPGVAQNPVAETRPYRQPIELPADPLLTEAFIEVMTAQSAGWELLLKRPAVYPAGWEDHTEELRWRHAGLHVSVQFTRYASVEEASAALYWDMAVLSIGFPKLKGFADEAYGHELDNRRFFRRGAYVVHVRAPMPPLVEVPDVLGAEVTVSATSGSAAGQKVARLHRWEYPPVDYATLFLAAMDRVTGAKPAQ